MTQAAEPLDGVLAAMVLTQLVISPTWDFPTPPTLAWLAWTTTLVQRYHFNSSYRYYKLVRSTTSQVDVGGFFPGDTLGTPSALSVRPQQPWFFVAGLTINVTSNTTNDLHYSYLRNYWSWSNPGGVPQFAQLGTDVGGAALEPFGEFSPTLALTPYNVNTQSVRTRFWDGHDNFLRDDVTMLKGNHLFTFGGAYQRNWDWHQRSDNGGGINYQATYQLGDSAGGGLVNFASTNPTGVTQYHLGARRCGRSGHRHGLANRLHAPGLRSNVESSSDARV